MIDTFPNFSSLHLEHKQSIENITSVFEPYSDFNFTSLFCWNIDGSTEISLLNGNLVISMPDYMGDGRVYSILGTNDIQQSVNELLSHFPELRFVPEPVIRGVKQSKAFSLVEDRNNFDYIYNLDHLARLMGISYKKKRNKLHGVKKALEGAWSVQTSTTPNAADKIRIRELFEHWARGNKQTGSEFSPEAKALDRLLAHSESLDLLFTILYVKGGMAGFSINEIINDQYAISHFEKALPVHENIYLLLSNLAAAELLENECKYINWEQDLGLEGLRKSKLSYQPARFLRKYSIQKRLLES